MEGGKIELIAQGEQMLIDEHLHEVAKLRNKLAVNLIRIYLTKEEE